MIIYNHLNITIFAHETFEKQQRIVGFEVEPFSLAEGDDRLMLNHPEMSEP